MVNTCINTYGTYRLLCEEKLMQSCYPFISLMQRFCGKVVGWAGTSDDIKYKSLGFFILGWLNSYAKPQINNTYVGISEICM